MPLYMSIVVIALLFSLVCILAPILTPICTIPTSDYFPFKNLKYNASPCRRMRYGMLLGLTPLDADVGRRMLVAVALAALIGYERRSPERAAGVRTMSVTALGACCFTISSLFAFESGTMHWDASRVTAAIPSGVGFLGSAIIWKGIVGDGTKSHHEVSGISTAASVWISASIGVAAGGALYYTAFFTTLCVILILRFGPKADTMDDARSESIEDSSEKNLSSDEKSEITPLIGSLEKSDSAPLRGKSTIRSGIVLSSHT